MCTFSVTNVLFVGNLKTLFAKKLMPTKYSFKIMLVIHLHVNAGVSKLVFNVFLWWQK